MPGALLLVYTKSFGRAENGIVNHPSVEGVHSKVNLKQSGKSRTVIRERNRACEAQECVNNSTERELRTRDVGGSAGRIGQEQTW